MPKRGRGNRNWKEGGSGRESGKYYYEHDDRVSDTTRRVSIKSGSNRISKPSRQRDFDVQIRTRLEDDDVDMSGIKGPGRYNPYSSKGQRNQYFGSRRGRPGRNSPTPTSSHRRLIDGPSNWYKIFIPWGGKYSKEYILKTLLNYISPSVFIPIAYKIQGSDSSFYIEDYKVAEKLLNADRKITTTEGYKLLVKVRPGMPNIQLDDQMKDKMKTAMGKRYNANTKALDLSKFHMDPDLVNETLVSLFRPNIMVAVIDIIAENIPDLTALNLSDNKLYTIDHLSIMTQKLPNLTILHIGNNRVRDIHQLDALQGLKLTQLVLDGNPLCDRFKEEGAYVSEVRKRFPKVLKLDGTDLPPPIVFDVSEDQQLPSNKGSFMCSPDGQLIVRQFLQQYYLLYDADNRQPLMDAYHEDALFSMTVAYPPGQGSSSNNAKLNTYFSDSRNIMRIKDTPRRLKLLHQGKLTIVSALSQLPKTRHDLGSFAVDLPLFNPQLMIVSINGMFMETEGSKNPNRSFSRVFVIVPQGTGFCITNDELFITNATDEQAKVAFKNPVAATPVTSPVSSPPITTGVPLDDGVKQQMVVALAQQTNMNVLWAKKCLDETLWDFQRALFVFSELHKQGKVPDEAFVK